MADSALEHRKGFSRRDFLRIAGVAAFGLPVYASEVSRHELSIERRTIGIPGLADPLRGLRIVQISDLHDSVYTEAYFLKQVVREVNRLKADVVVLTGDFVTLDFGPVESSVAYANRCAEIVSAIECPRRYAVLGNHDSSWNMPAVTSALTTAGIPVLNNRSEPYERDGKRLWFAGVGDALYHYVDLEAAIPATARADQEPVILLAHEPDILPDVARYGVDLMLSGHTHGGQVRLPFLPAMFLPPLGHDYVEGLYRLGPTQLYVNRGIGTVNLPFRFNCPPEITVITLG